MIKKILISTILILSLSACSIVQTSNGDKYNTLGIATIKRCEEVINAETKHMGKRCITVETGAFSGWEAIAGGIANAVVKILTLGLISTPGNIK